MNRKAKPLANRFARLIFGPLTLLLLAGCASDRPMMPTPHVYSEGHERLFADLHPDLRVSTVPVFYVTDRAQETDEEGNLSYGHGRSRSLAFGEATVEIGQHLSWEAVREASLTSDRPERITLELVALEEFGRTPATPFPYQARGGFYEHDAETLTRARAAAALFQEKLNERLAITPRQELLVYVHGYNNSFRDAALTIAEMWHFFGREGVPVLYTWPAGLGGLAGYGYDRESGEFTVFHLKMLLKELASNRGIDGFNIIAHSRGSDVTLTALRELFLESRAAGVDPLEQFRIKHLVLAAPDLDFDVVLQRLASEPIAPGIGTIDVYVSPNDKALGLAELLLGSVRRVGRLGLSMLTGADRRLLERADSDEGANVIELRGDGGSFGHSYFHQNPAVSSDIFLTLRFNRAPGFDQGRPLQQQEGRMFLIEDDYLLTP